MKKTLIALAVLGSIAGVAQAQSSVTIYGKLDLGLAKVTGTPTSMQSKHSSRLGFKGAEDLGGGLSAIFQIENRFQADSGLLKGNVKTSADPTGKLTNDTLFEGQAIVGLTGGFGTVKLGRTGNVVDSVGSVQADPNGGDGIANLGALTDARYSNSVTYITPSMSGFKASAQAVLSEVKGLDNGYGVAGTYNNGPIYVGLGYQKLAQLVASPAQTNVWGMSGSYAFGPAKVLLGYDQKDFDNNQPKQKHAVIGATYAIGAGLIQAAYGQTKEIDTDRTYTLGYLHSMSKRTSLYADVARTNFGAAGAESENGVAVGVTHNF